MEESQKLQSINFQKQLLNLSALQQQIQQTKKQVSQLLKIESSQHRNLHTIYHHSILTARNKLNLIQKDDSKQKLHHMQSDQLMSRQEQVREIREKQEHDLREVREQLKKSREKERLVIRNNSLRYDRTIKKNRQLNLEIKERLVRDIRKEKENYKHSLAQSRLQESKQKEVQLFQTTLAKIDRQPFLQRELQKLNREKELVQKRVDERKQLKTQFCGQVEKLRKMKLQQVKELVEGGQESSIQPRLVRCVKSLQSLSTLKATLLQKQPDLKLVV